MIARSQHRRQRVRIRLIERAREAAAPRRRGHVALRSDGAAIVPASDRRPDLRRPAVDDRASGHRRAERSGGSDRSRRCRTSPSRCICPRPTRAADRPPDGMHTAYIAQGNVTGQATLDATTTTTAYLWLSAVDVLAPAAAGAIVAFGDSITDGDGDDARRGSRLGVAAGGEALVGRPGRRAGRGRTSACPAIACCGTASASARWRASIATS